METNFLELDLNRKTVSAEEVANYLNNNLDKFYLSISDTNEAYLVVSITTKVNEMKADKDPIYANKVDPERHGVNSIDTKIFKLSKLSKKRTGSNFENNLEYALELKTLQDERNTILSYSPKRFEYSSKIFSLETISNELIKYFKDTDYDIDFSIMDSEAWFAAISNTIDRMKIQEYYKIGENNLNKYSGF